MMTPKTRIKGMTSRHGQVALVTLLTLFTLIACGGGGSSSSAGDPNNITISGVVDDGGNSAPIANASCRFVDADGHTQDTDTCDQNGLYQLSVPQGVQGFIYCSPPTVPNLILSTFASTVGALPGGEIGSENVTPATTVTADIIQHEDPDDPDTRKRELLNDIVTKADPNLDIVVAMATRLYRTMLAQQVNAGFRSGGNSGSGGDGGDGDGRSDDGGVGGEAGDGADFSPLSGARCSFVVGTDPLSAEPAYPSAMADFLADGELDRPDLAPLASSVSEGLDYGADNIKLAFNEVFSQGMGEAFATVTDAEGRYFLPIPANLPGFVRCTPKDHETLSLTTPVPGRSTGTVLDDQEVSPATTLFSYVIAPLIITDLATIKTNFLADVQGLEILLSGPNLPQGPLTGMALGPNLPASSEVGLVAFSVTALYSAFFKNGLDVDFSMVIAHLVDDQAVDPDYLISLGLSAEQANLVKDTVASAAETLDTDLATALSTARVNVTVMNADDGGGLVEGAVVDIPSLDSAVTCEGCTSTTDAEGQKTLTLSPVPLETVTPIQVRISSVPGFAPLETPTEVVALATVDLDVTLSTTTTFELTVQGGGEGGGSVTSNPAGIDCAISGSTTEGDCSEPYIEGSEVILTATPDADSAFSGWNGGACSDAETTCAVSMETETTVTARFAPRCADAAYAFSPANLNFPNEGGTGSFAVTASTGCPWSAIEDAPWIEIDSGSGNGDGTISYRVSANTGVGRSATISIGENTHTVTQDAGPCTFSIPQSSHESSASGESYAVAIAASHGECHWTADESSSWITLAPTSGTGSGTVQVTVSPNGSRSRKDTIAFAGRPHTVNQAAGPCTYSIDPTSRNLSASGESYDVNITATHSECAWTASENSSWANLTPTSGEGRGTVQVSVDPNTGEPRQANLTIAGQGHTLTQTAPLPVITVSPGDPIATESRTDVDTADFSISRTGSTASALQVDISMDGTATNGSDYTTILGQVTFKEGQSVIIVELRPILDGIYESDETARMTINPGSTYTRGSVYRASVTIRNYSSLAVDQVNLPAWDEAWTNIQAENQVTQTFTPGLNNIRSVEIDLLTANQGFGADTISLEIWRGKTRLVASQQSVDDGFEGLLKFEFADPIATTPGETLRMVVTDTTLTIGWKWGGNTYAGGSAFHHGTTLQNYDFFFRTNGYK